MHSQCKEAVRESIHASIVVQTVQQRGAAVIKARKLSSAMSAAKAAADHMKDWWCGTQVRSFCFHKAEEQILLGPKTQGSHQKNVKTPESGLMPANKIGTQHFHSENNADRLIA